MNAHAVLHSYNPFASLDSPSSDVDPVTCETPVSVTGIYSELVVRQNARRPGSLGTPGKKDQASNSSSCGGPRPTATAPSLGPTLLHPSSSVTSGHGVHTTGPQDSIFLPIIFPPIPFDNSNPNKFEPDFDALYDAIVPPEPPIFLRSPSRAFLGSLYQLAGIQ